MKKILILLVLVSIICLSSCTSKSDFENGKKQLETQGYIDVKNTGYQVFCCDQNDSFSTGFQCKNKNGEVVKGCICSGLTKGITIRFE